MKMKLGLPVVFLFVANAASASVINFETLPDGSMPSDNQELTEAYADDGVTVRFGFDSSADGKIDINPFFERSLGSDSTPQAFINNQLVTWDEAQSGDLGDYLLRGGGFGQSDAIPGVFIIEYQTPGVTALSGEIWDVDGGGEGGIFERWDFRVIDVDGDLVATATTGFGTQAFDARPFVFSFADIADGVQRVEIEYTGNRAPVNVGLAFDNFNATQAAVPEPTSGAALFLLSLATVLSRTRKT